MDENLSEKNIKENKMGTAPVGRLMLSMGIPMILSMMLQALYNIVDSAFVSNMADSGEAALNALTLAFPVQMLMVAISIGTGVGIGALLSKSLGQGNRKKVNQTAGNAIFLGAVIYLVFLCFGIFGVNGYVSTQTSNQQIKAMAIQYLRICSIISPGIVFFLMFEKLLQSTGKSLYSTIAQISGAVANIILDPLLIYGIGIFPKLGVAGAAYATVIGQLISLEIAVIFHFTINKEISNGAEYLRPDMKIIKEIYSIGLPAIIAQALMSFMTYGLNLILVRVSENAVTAYGLYYKIQQFILFAAFGLRDAIAPIVSFNYGLGSRKCVHEGIRFGLIYTLIIMFIGMVCLEIFAAPLSKVFGLSGETMQMCISAIRVISLSFMFAGANVAFQGIFQAMEGGLASLIISVCRQCLFVLPVAYAFSLIAIKSLDKLWLVWLTFPIAEATSLLITLIFFILVNKRTAKILK